MGEAPRVTSVLPPAVPDSKPGYFHFETDIPRAKALLAEAGYPNGIDITLTYSDAQWFEEGIAIQLKESFARAGIRLTLEKKTEAEVLAATAKRQVPFFFLRDSPLVLDPFYKLYIDSHPKGASNRNDFADPEYARIVDQGPAGARPCDPHDPGAARAANPRRRRDLDLPLLPRRRSGDGEFAFRATPGIPTTPHIGRS